MKMFSRLVATAVVTSFGFMSIVPSFAQNRAPRRTAIIAPAATVAGGVTGAIVGANAVKIHFMRAGLNVSHAATLSFLPIGLVAGLIIGCLIEYGVHKQCVKDDLSGFMPVE